MLGNLKRVTFLIVSIQLLIPLSLSAQAVSDDFEDGDMSNWQTFAAGWIESDGVFHATNTAPNTPVSAVWAGGYAWTDYSVEADMKQVSTYGGGSSDLSLLLRFNAPYPLNDYCMCRLSNSITFGQNLELVCPALGEFHRVPFSFSLGQFYRLRATAVGQDLTCEVVGEPGIFIARSIVNLALSGTAGLRSTHIKSDFDNFIVSALSPDADGDGVPDNQDVCAETVIPESVPTRLLGTNRWALVDDDTIFDTTPPPGGGGGPGLSFTVEQTGGCSCEQIIEALGLGQGHVKFGCSISAMEGWVELVNP